MQSNLQVGVIGCGLVGTALVQRLQAADLGVQGFDVAPRAHTKLREFGIACAKNISDLTHTCEVLLIAVLDDAALLNVAQQICTAIQSAHTAPQLVLSCVTASPEALETARGIFTTSAESLAVKFAELTLLGSSQQIAQGEALGLLGASAEIAEKWADFFKILSPNYQHCGALGQAARAKLACNLVLGLNRAALAEGLAFAEYLGLDGTQFLQLLKNSPAYSRAVDVAGPRMLARDFAPLSRIAQHRKDLALMLQQMPDLPLTQAHANVLDRAIAQGLGEADNVALISVYDTLNLMLKLTLPTLSGTLADYTLMGQPLVANQPKSPASKAFNRIAYSAAHVVNNPRAVNNPWLDCNLDWDATLQYRHYLWSQGLGVAEAMDTAQRGMGLDWPTSLELITRSLAEARSVKGALIASGCGTDHLPPEQAKTVDDVIRAYEEQMAAIEKHGGTLIVMASRALVRVAKNAGDYEKVYARILQQAQQPVILHWLGDMFDPALTGYWGSHDVPTATQTALNVIRAFPHKVAGIKISLLDKNQEILMRRQLPEGVRMFTGDDFNYAELIAGDGVGEHLQQQQSDALLGIFDAIAPAASAALNALAQGDSATFHKILAPTVPLSRHIFAAPTRFYKTGVVCMAWLNGHQSHFTMVGGQHSTRSIAHLAELFRLADAANLLLNPEDAVLRMKNLLATQGIH